MSHGHFLLGVVMAFQSLLICAQEQRPNIILIMADDMGYADIGCYGSEIKTPNLDKLAANGLRFRQFYNGARCCPTRASLVTGLYAHQAGIGHMTNDPEDAAAFDYGVPAYRGDINDQSVTFAEVLKAAGYQTLMTGKWHLGYHDRNKWPLQRGFDKYYGILAGASNYFNPTGKRGLTWMNDPIEPEGDNFYTTDAFTDYALRFIKENRQQEKKQPFFLYLAYTSPHWPLNAMKQDIDKYRGKYKAGWTALRGERLKRMKSLGVIDDVTGLSADDGAGWDALTPEQKDEMDYRMAIYAAQIDRMDQNIGRLIQNLEQSGTLDHTLILFLSDNGACAEGGMLGGGKKELLGTKGGYMLSYGQSWANASVTPFKKYKHWVYEGGIGTPLIAYWPAKMPQAIKGKFTNQYGFLPDIMTTLVNVSGATYPQTYKGNTITPMQGSSLLPLLLGNDKPIHHAPIFWEHEGNAAVRYGDLKLVREYKPGNASAWELYDISKDRSELHDLSAKMPDKVAQLSKDYEQWAKKVGVLPYEEVLRIRAEKRKAHKQ